MSTHAKSDSDSICDISGFKERVHNFLIYDGTERAGAGDQFVESLYRLNLQDARLALFKEQMLHARYKSTPEGLVSSNLPQKISRYSNALADYRVFVDSLNISERLRSNSIDLASRLAVLKSSENELRLFDIAAHELVLDEFIRHDEENNLGTDEITKKYADIRKKLSQDKRVHYERNAWNSNYKIDLEEGRKAKLREQKHSVELLQKLLTRLGMAAFGGLTVIVPMLIMTLHPTLLTVLLTTSLFVLVVGFLIAIFMPNTEPKDIVSATAAYAAIFVVLVGVLVDKAITEPSSDSPSHGKVIAIVIGVTAGIAVLLIIMIFLARALLVSLKSSEEKQRQADSV